MGLSKATSALGVAISLFAGTIVAANTASDETHVPGRNAWWAPGETRPLGQMTTYENEAGRLALFNASGTVPTKGHPFFAPIGKNGRACVTCHQPVDSMSLSAQSAQARWNETKGRDVLFAPIDGSNCPSLPQQDRASHSLLLDHGLIRIPRPWPPRDASGSPVAPEFSIEVVADPTGCNLDPIYGIKSAKPMISVFRRPRVSANIGYVETSFDPWSPKLGRTLPQNPTTHAPIPDNLMADARVALLEDQVADAGSGHLEMVKAMKPQQRAQLATFLRQIYVAQDSDRHGKPLTYPGSERPVRALSTGPRSVLGPMPIGKYAMFPELAPLLSKSAIGATPWEALWGRENYPQERATRSTETAEDTAFRDSVARGYDIFVNRSFLIRNVSNYNNIGLGNPNWQTCANCHNRQRLGNDNAPGYMDLGVISYPDAEPLPHLPLFKVTCRADVRPHPFKGRVIYTYDPGRALVTGKCRDVGSITMQSMRGLTARAPYFASGAAKDLRSVVEFYDRRFQIGLTASDKTDLTNFLSVL